MFFSDESVFFFGHPQHVLNFVFCRSTALHHVIIVKKYLVNKSILFFGIFLGFEILINHFAYFFKENQEVVNVRCPIWVEFKQVLIGHFEKGCK